MTELIDDSERSSVGRDAWLAADEAMRAARVEIRLLDEMSDLEAVRRLYERIWSTGNANPPVTADLLKAVAKAGSYVSGAYEGTELVGASFGFFAEPARRALHSHIAGVLGRTQGRNVGFALKLHQRAWALTRGAGEITWTFDPLIRRNAHFNLAKLAAQPSEYLTNFYGPMDDGINRRDPSDRLLVLWRLTSEAVALACEQQQSPATPLPGGSIALQASASGGPAVRPAEGPVVLVGIPPDVESLRERDAGSAAEWRLALREVLTGLMAAGGRIRTFHRAGWYVVDTQEEQ